MNREELQSQAADSLFRNKRLLCQWATGTGKSGVVLKFLQNHPGKCLIVVPEQNNKENWVDEFVKFGVSLDGVYLACYASLHKYQNTHWDLVVFDEAPHADTAKRISYCKSLKAEHVLALGAVIDDEELAALESNYGKFKKSTISLTDAINVGILPTPKVYICHITLSKQKRTFWKNGAQYDAVHYYEYLQNQVDATKEAYMDNPTEANQQKMFRAGIARKRFLGELKFDAVKYICNGLEGKNRRFLCFCNSIKQAENLCKEHAFTSHTPSSMKLLDKFNNKEINSLFVVGKLIEGQNLKDIDCGVITQLGRTTRITIQSIGRVMRSKNPVIWVPVFDGTIDDSFLNTITYHIPAQYISHYKL